jgi:hypothetical protein
MNFSNHKSTTGMFNGLRKMVGGGTKGGSSDDDCRTPGGITPLIKSAKKRKAETPALPAFSAKRKYVLLCTWCWDFCVLLI